MQKTTKQEAVKKLLETSPHEVLTQSISREASKAEQQLRKGQITKQLDSAIKDHRDVLVVLVKQ